MRLQIDGNELNASHHGKMQKTKPLTSSVIQKPVDFHVMNVDVHLHENINWSNIVRCIPLTSHINANVADAINTNRIYIYIENDRTIQLEVEMTMNYRTLKIRWIINFQHCFRWFWLVKRKTKKSTINDPLAEYRMAWVNVHRFDVMNVVKNLHCHVV